METKVFRNLKQCKENYISVNTKFGNCVLWILLTLGYMAAKFSFTRYLWNFSFGCCHFLIFNTSFLTHSLIQFDFKRCTAYLNLYFIWSPKSRIILLEGELRQRSKDLQKLLKQFQALNWTIDYCLFHISRSA